MKVHAFAPNIVIGITFYWFEAGQNLVLSRSNYFCRTDNANFAHLFGSILIDRDQSQSNYLAHDGQQALNV